MVSAVPGFGPCFGAALLDGARRRRGAPPCQVVARGAEVARGEAAGIFQFAAVINVNLAVVNLLPLPALDGGFIALLGLEARLSARNRALRLSTRPPPAPPSASTIARGVS